MSQYAYDAAAPAPMTSSPMDAKGQSRVSVFYRTMVLAAAVLALGVVILGAYVRLSDAGLGCPDWPGCYGHMVVPETPVQLQSAQERFPGQPVEAHKAWKEMVHRYFAGTLGVLIALIGIGAWGRRQRAQASPVLPTILIGLVIFQALLGMWTVTLLLKPVIVSAHLLGGMATLGVLSWLALRALALPGIQGTPAGKGLRPWAWIGLALVYGQIALGGWVSSNYAALACSDFPFCHGAWVPPMDFPMGFHLVRDLGRTADGGFLPLDALTAIHWTHRLGALITFCYVGWLAVRARRMPGLRRLAWTIMGILCLQVALGISNVVFSLPLPVAVAHNGGAALLLVSMVALNYLINSPAKPANQRGKTWQSV